MKLAVIIATIGRKMLVNRILENLERQSRLPDEVIISAPDSSHVIPFESELFKVTYLYGKKGLAAQRNRALDKAREAFDIITYFDDDFLAGVDYLKGIEQTFIDHEEISVITGNVVADGINGPGLSYEQGMNALTKAEQNAPSEQVKTPCYGAYGCNMSLRAACIGERRFDERLVLYGWQEDIDFTSQLAQCGDIIELNTVLGVHLGIKSGRVSGVRLGYSQLVNPIYLMGKGTMPIGRGSRLIVRNLLANLAKSFWSEPYIDRRGRLRGNLLAFGHLFSGKVEPEYVLKL